MNSNRIRIGVLGCASIAKRSVIPAIGSLPDKFKLIAVASRSAEKAKEFGRLFNAAAITGYENLVDREDIDAIYMPLPTGLHEAWILSCLDKGKHVLVEKSLAMNYDSARKIIDRATSKRLLVMENFMFRHHAQHEFVFGVIDQGRIGQKRLFRSQFGFPPLDKTNFRYDRKAGGGSLLDAGAYTVMASQLFLEREIEVQSSNLVLDSTTEVDIYGNATLINGDGLTAQISFGFDNFYQCNYEIWGSKGKVTAEKAFTPKPTEEPKISVETREGNDLHFIPAEDHFMKTLSYFFDCIRKKEFDKEHKEILNQSRILTAIREKAVIGYL